MFGRDGIEQVIKRLDADGRQHVIAFLGGDGDVGHNIILMSLRARGSNAEWAKQSPCLQNASSQWEIASSGKALLATTYDQ
jgi:hypothetical protein